MKTARQWALELPPDVLEHPMPFPVRLDYAEKIIKRIQAESVQNCIDLIEGYQKKIWRVDSNEANAVRAINCYLRSKLLHFAP